MNYFVLEKEHFASVKGKLFFSKGHSDNPGGGDRWRLKSLSSEVLFEKPNLDLEKKIFFKKDTFNKASDTRRIISLKLILVA